MMLHGSWTYGNMKSSGGDFVTGGHLGWMNFPPVEGGKGDPSDTVGNPGQYLSISSKASDAQKQIALDYFKTGVLTDAEVKEWIKTGSVPIVKSAGEPAQLGRRRCTLPEVRLRHLQQGEGVRAVLGPGA